MAENMTLEQVRDYHHLIAARHEAAGTDGEAYEKHMGMRNAIDAHRAKIEAVINARAFHEAYERLAPSFGYATREETRSFDPESNNGKLMIAVCAEIEHKLQSALGEMK